MWKMMQYWASVGIGEPYTSKAKRKTKKYDLVVWDFPHFSTTFRFDSRCTAVETTFPTRTVSRTMAINSLDE